MVERPQHFVLAGEFGKVDGRGGWQVGGLIGEK